MPRNRIIVQALRELLERQARRWPEGFFSAERLTRRDLEELRSGEEDFDRQIVAERRSRAQEPF